MGDLIIKPASSGNLKIQDQGGTERISLNTSGLTTFAANVALSDTMTGGTLASAVTFPAGHIIQVVDATLTNIATPEEAKTSETVVANATNQITITSGNKFHIYAQVTLRGIASSNVVLEARLREGTDTTGTILSKSNFMNNNTSATFHSPHFLIALDDSPASTTPSYTLTMLKGSGGTSSVSLKSDDASFLKIILMEIQA